jgi:hypothetical protein
MISSRWPRPIGIIASIALMPVCIGSWTDLRAMMPGRLDLDLAGLGAAERALAVDRLPRR